MSIPSGASVITIVPGPRPGVYFGQALSPADDPIHSGHIWDDFVGNCTVAKQVGDLGWDFVGSVVMGTPADNHPGIITHRSLAGALGYLVLANLWTYPQFVIPSGLSVTWIYRVVPLTLDAARRIGMFAPWFNPPHSGLYLEHLSGETNWYAVVRDITAVPTQIRVDTGIAVDVSWRRLRVTANTATNQIDFYIDDDLRASVNYILAPAAETLYPASQIMPDGAVIRTLDADLFDMRFSNLVR